MYQLNSLCLQKICNRNKVAVSGNKNSDIVRIRPSKTNHISNNSGVDTFFPLSHAYPPHRTDKSRLQHDKPGIWGTPSFVDVLAELHSPPASCLVYLRTNYVIWHPSMSKDHKNRKHGAPRIAELRSDLSALKPQSKEQIRAFSNQSEIDPRTHASIV